MYYYIEVRNPAGIYTVIGEEYSSAMDAMDTIDQIDGSFEWRLVGYPYSLFN